MELAAGVTLGPYSLVRVLGEGGFGVVWQAQDDRLGRSVAIKFIKPAYAHVPQLREDFQREARAISRLDHPNILTVFDIGEQDGWAYMVTPFMAGGTLHGRVTRRILPMAGVIAILEPLAAALDYAHGQRFVHRDVKPANVLFNEHGRLVLSDFGLARVMETESFVRLSGNAIGTPAYMSPEQGLGREIGPVSDLYSLGVIAYEMLIGRRPFTQSDGHALVNAHISLPPAPPRSINPALPEAVESALLKMLAKEPRERFRSGQEFVAALHAATASPKPAPPSLAPEPPVTTPQPTPAPPLSISPKAARSRRAVVLGLGDTSLASALRTLTGHTDSVYDVSFSPDGQLLASGSRDKTVRLWQVADGSAVHTLTGHTSSVNGVVFSPDGQLLASGSSDETVRLWRAADGSAVQTLTGHTDGVLRVVFSPDGQLLASGSIDSTVRLWRVADGSTVRTFTGHTDVVRAVVFSPDGQLLASASRDKTIRLWRAP